ncbi:hypothetical protein DIPPA_02458 [Diplonema papillatum]|nr:hypothetical protein DIPPA_02458 [Diplonema papillatum]
MEGLFQSDMQSLVDLCDPQGATHRQWEEDRANGKRVTGYSSSVAGQAPAPAPAGSLVNPGKVGPAQDAPPAATFTAQKKTTKIPIDEAEIWDEDDLDDQLHVGYVDDRERPEYEILHKQAVGANDIFLGLDYEKDTSSSSCEEMVLRVQLPKETAAKDIKLDVNRESVDLRSPHYRLLLPLQKVVLTNQGSAKWEADKKRMVITLVVDKSAYGKTMLL